MTEMHVAICAAGRGLVEARVLAASVAAHRPDWPITVLVLAGGEPLPLRDDEPFDVVRAIDLDDPSLVRAINATTHERQAALAGPAVVEHLFAAGAPAVLLLASDAQLVSGPAELEAMLDDHDAVVVPRVGAALPDDGERPDASDLAEAGETDDGVFAVRNTDRGRAVTAWWSAGVSEAMRAMASVERAGPDEPPRRLGATPPLSALRALEGVGVLEHPGYSLSAWNLHARPLGQDGQALTAGGAPARILRFPGFDAGEPWWLSRLATRISVLDDPVLEQLCGERARALRAAGWPEQDVVPAGQRRLANGLRYDQRLRRLHLEALEAGEDFGDVFEPAGAAAFTAWLNEPAVIGARQGMTRYHHDVWLSRPDLMTAYPALDGAEDAEGFTGWLWVHGRNELGLHTPLLPPPPAWVPRTHADVPAVLVSGYLRGVVGLGEAARRYLLALEVAGVSVATNVIPTDPPGQASARKRGETVDFADRTLPDGVGADVHLLCVNADLTPAALEDLPEGDRPPYVIGTWAWETDTVPDRWDVPFRMVDEVWVYTSWIAGNIAPSSPVPVVVMPVPVATPDPAGARVPFELPDAYTFLFTFDHFSTIDRKNPVGLIRAFQTAFAPGEGPVLVVKTINADFHPRSREALRHAAAGRSDIHIVDSVLEGPELAALMSSCDCYVSLHRAEGFGMGLAEAMALGKPAIATGWSGNTDFMTASNSLLVDYALRTVGPDNPPYDPDGTWAEPSLEHAAALMRQVWEDPEAARAMGERGRSDIQRHFTLAPVGARARERLERLAALHEFGGERSLAEPASWTLTGLDHRLRFDRTGRAASGGVRGIAKRSLLRALKPYTAPQEQLDVALADAVSRIAAEIEGLRAARDRDRDRLAALERQLARRRDP